MKLGIVGLGRMGAAISRRLRQQGFDVTGWDQSAKVNQALAADGLRIAGNARGVAAAADVVISSITEDHGVRKIFTGPAGFLEGDVTGKLFIEMSTLQPMTGRELLPLVEARGARLIEAPVLGTIPQVQAGTLFAMVGGKTEDVERARPVLEKLTRRIVHMGGNGSGYAMKLAANLGLGAYIQAIAESLALGLQQGLDARSHGRRVAGERHGVRLAQEQGRGAQGQQGRHDARHSHAAQRHHVGGRDRRAQRRADAAGGGHAGVAVGCGRRRLRRRRSRRIAKILSRRHAAKIRSLEHDPEKWKPVFG